MKRTVLAALSYFSLQTLAFSLPATYAVTAYCHCAKCCGRANQLAADGHMPRAGVTVAGPRSLPLGTHVWIEGLGERIVTDRLAISFDNRFDIFMTSHRAARRFGLQQLHVTILK